MKKMFCFLSLMVIFASCSTDEQEVQMEEMNVEVQKSTSLRVALESIKNLNMTTTGKFTNATDAVNADELCFQFEFPIILEYNTGNQITITDYEQLLGVLLDETVAVHLTAIGFPFEITQYSTNTTMMINDEAEFENLVEACGYDTVGVVDVVALTENCFTVNYPVTVLVNELPETFNDQTSAENYFYGNIQTIQSIDFQYPFSVHLVSTDSDLQINNDYELVTLINDTCGIN